MPWRLTLCARLQPPPHPQVNYTEEQMAELKVYYSKLADKYLPTELDW